MNTRDQKRAQGAYERVEKVSKAGDDLKDEYNSLSRKLPSLLQQCGLCQTVAFLEAKGAKSKAHGKLLSDLAEVVLESTQDAAKTLGQKARAAELRDYQWLSRNTIQCANWFKRYSEALLGEAQN